jgi:hypothetical protein
MRDEVAAVVTKQLYPPEQLRFRRRLIIACQGSYQRLQFEYASRRHQSTEE